MSYSVTCKDVEFTIPSQNISNTIEALVKSKYFDLGYPKEDCLNIARTGVKEEQQQLLYELLHDYGYIPEYNPDGNMIGLSHENENWYDDTELFDVFAQYVEKGSYLEMAGEDGQLWRMLFDGEHCTEVSPVILWPDTAVPECSLTLDNISEIDSSHSLSDFRLVRQVQGTSFSISLTADELYQAYVTKEHLYDIQDIREELNRYNASDDTRENFYDQYGIDLSEVLNQPAIMEEMAYVHRKNKDKYGMEWTAARDDAIQEVLGIYKESMDKKASLDQQIQLASVKAAEGLPVAGMREKEVSER